MSRLANTALTSTIALVVWNMTSILDLAQAQELSLKLRYQKETSVDSGRFHLVTREESWQPEETAIIVCDVWDFHHCLNAVRRIEQFAPRLNDVLIKARKRGITIIHAPSDCMPAYQDHPARQRATAAPTTHWTPYQVASWCSALPAEERGAWPIDQSDGGEDDDPREHAEWVAKLQAMGRNPGTPWQKQSELIEIDPKVDFISDRGDEVWNVLEMRGIRNVILSGVHTNMCVIGRPFGLRQMARNGKNVVLMRDMTDTMYNPQRWPYVSHFTGTDLIVSHIERFVCPTMTSDQLVGDEPFRFEKDTRPHLVMMVAEDEYETSRTLPVFATRHLGHDFRVTVLFGNDRERHDIPGCEGIDNADVLLVSVRRRWLPKRDMERIRKFVQSGKPVIGIRTASHAFSVRNQAPPEDLADWTTFDADVFGGNYHGHHANGLKSTVRAVEGNSHPILTGMARDPFPQGWSLYQTSPLAKGANVLLTGSVEGHAAEPVAWTFDRADGGKSFYTSLGNPDDFAHPQFQKLLVNAIRWATELPVSGDTPTGREDFHDHWSTVDVPESVGRSPLSGVGGVGWYRCTVHVPAAWLDGPLTCDIDGMDGGIEGWFNGQLMTKTSSAEGTTRQLIDPQHVNADDANLLVIRVEDLGGEGKLRTAPQIRSAAQTLRLEGRWQFRLGDNAAYATMPLPAKFGTSSDVVFAPPEPLWQARPLTRIGQFTPGIEGPACDPDGNVFAVNFARQGTIGRIRPDGAAEVFVQLPGQSIGNGIRFDAEGTFFYVADYTMHNVLQVDRETRKITVLAHETGMNQPNDLAIAPDGTLYASDPDWSTGTGQLWRIDRDGTTTRLADKMGTTNGIEVSPDGRFLYVNESIQRNIWAFEITEDRKLANKRLLRKFADHGFDGMRCDMDGNLYVTRYGKGTVVKVSAQGDLLQEIDVLGKRPSNLCFGGIDGRTIYVTEVDYTRLVRFRADRPGRAWKPSD